jgi:hypothetical protein
MTDPLTSTGNHPGPLPPLSAKLSTTRRRSFVHTCTWWASVEEFFSILLVGSPCISFILDKALSFSV